MSQAFIVLPAAEADVQDAHDWYELRRKGLGDQFLLCVEDAFARIRRQPDAYGLVSSGLRRTIVHRFPYGVFYRTINSQIIVVGVFHGRQDPRRWQSRY